MYMQNLSEESAQLAPLQTFDPNAFVGNNEVPQNICNFILALALVYNDCKNGMSSNLLLADFRPVGKPRTSRSWGNYNGMKFHYIRLHVGLLHELFSLIEENRDVIQHSFFGSVIKLLPSPARGSWEDLVAASLGTGTSSPMGRTLLMIRNKVAFHYDCKEIYRGYRRHFFRNDSSTEQAFVSRGNSMRRSRLYFADAAAEGYFQSQFDKTPVDQFMNSVIRITGDLNHAIMLIVDRFIQRRGYAYQDYKED